MDIFLVRDTYFILVKFGFLYLFPSVTQDSVLRKKRHAYVIVCDSEVWFVISGPVLPPVLYLKFSVSKSLKLKDNSFVEKESCFVGFN